MAFLRYLLDTNICILLLGDGSPRIDCAYREGLLSGWRFFVSSVSLFELAYGVSKSEYVYLGQSRLHDFLSGQIEVMGFGHRDAVRAGHVRAELERRKQPIGPYDTLIAGQAIAQGMTLVTTNVREFSRVEGLAWEDWSRGERAE